MSLLLETNVFSQKSELISKIEPASLTSKSKTEGLTLTVSSQMVNSAPKKLQLLAIEWPGRSSPEVAELLVCLRLRIRSDAKRCLSLGYGHMKDLKAGWSTGRT
jgi:hypothetical protein